MDESTRGRILRIWVKRAHKGPMDGRSSVRLLAGAGIEGNADQGGKRQVTLVDQERWARAQRELGAEVDPVVRRANMLVSGVRLADTRGKDLQIGAVRLRVHGETTPCEMLDRAHPGLKDALVDDLGGGVYAEVLEGGDVAVGDAVVCLDDAV